MLATFTAVGTLLAGIGAFLAVWSPFVGEERNASVPQATAKDEDPMITTLLEVPDALAVVASQQLPGSAATYNAYEPLASASSSVTVPAEWIEHELGDWLGDDGEIVGEYISAGTDLSVLYDDDAVEPGIYIAVSPVTQNSAGMLAEREPARDRTCDGGEPEKLADDEYLGTFRIWSGCGPAGSVILDLGATDRKSGVTIMVFARLTHSRDVSAVRTALSSFDTDVKPPFDGERYPSFPLR